MVASNVFIGDRVDVLDERVRVAVKDNIDVAGLPTTAGTAALDSGVPVLYDAPVVATMRRAGVAFVGKTNLDELANGATGINPWFGTVENPTDKSCITGGSSAGSAAAVGFGSADIALGTDTGGSLRIPAALCGVAGFKPTKGYFSTKGVYPTADRMDVVGPMARTVSGISEGLRLMSGSSRVPDQRPLKRVGRIRFKDDETRVDEVVDSFLQNSDVDTVDLEIPEWETAHEVAYTIIAYQCWQNNRELLEESESRVGQGALTVIRDGEQISEAHYGEALGYGNFWAINISALLQEYDLLACPTVSRLAPKIEEADQIDWSNFSRTMQFSLSGHPALSAPLDVPGSHLKTGIQFIGRYGEDAPLVSSVSRLFPED